MDWMSMIPTDLMSMMLTDWMSTLTWVLTLGAHWFHFVKWCFKQSVQHTQSPFIKAVLFCSAVVMFVGVPLGGLYTVTPTPLITFAGYIGGLLFHTVYHCAFKRNGPATRSRLFWYDTTRPWLLTMMVPLLCASMQHFIDTDGVKTWVNQKLNLPIDSQIWFARASNDKGVTENLLLKDLQLNDCNPWQEDFLYSIVGRPFGESLGVLTTNNEVNCDKQNVNLTEWLSTMNSHRAKTESGKDVPLKLKEMYHNAQVDNPDCLPKNVLEAVLKESGYSATIVPWNDKAHLTKNEHYCVKNNEAPSSLAKLQSDAAAFAKMVGDAATSSGQPAPKNTEYTVYSWIAQLVRTLWFVLAQLVQTLVFAPLQWLYQRIKMWRKPLQAEAVERQVDVETFVKKLDFEGLSQKVVDSAQLKDLHVALSTCYQFTNLYVRLYWNTMAKWNVNSVEFLKKQYSARIGTNEHLYFWNLALTDNGHLVENFMRKYPLVHTEVRWTPLAQRIFKQVSDAMDKVFDEPKDLSTVFENGCEPIQTIILWGCLLTMVNNHLVNKANKRLLKQCDENIRDLMLRVMSQRLFVYAEDQTEDVFNLIVAPVV
jgi:hypothetical protein